jgi:hypothetical protein
MVRLLCWLLVLVLLAIGVVAVGVLLRQRREAGLDMPIYSVWSEADDGLGEAANLLRGLGWQPVALTRPIQAVRHRGLLVVTLASRTETGRTREDHLSETDAQALLHWVAEGNTLLFAADMMTPLHEALGITRTGHGGQDEDYDAARLGHAGGYVLDVKHLDVRPRATLEDRGGTLPLWYIRRQPGALLIHRGKGRILVLADPDLLTRRGLIRATGQPRDDNALFLVNVVSMHAEDGKVYFDEYHHGIRSASGFWAYAGSYGERITLLLVLAVAGVAMWRAGVRLGPAVAVPRTRQTDAVDYASALGLLYQRAGARRRLARALVRGFLGALTRHLRLRQRALPAVVLAEWRQHHSTGADQLERLLRGVNDLPRGAPTEQQLLQWTRAFDAFVNTFHKPGAPATGPHKPGAPATGTHKPEAPARGPQPSGRK